MRATVATIAALSLFATAAVAGEKKAEDKNDPNRMICEKQQVEGSRLATKKVCMTASEWKMKRLEERQTIDKAQTQRGTTGN